MGTRSFIAMKTQAGYRGVYCHWNGYLEDVGRIRRRHYTNCAKLAELIEHGDISSLGAEIGSAAMVSTIGRRGRLVLRPRPRRE